jgi:recombinational DNA repair protein (RecF pathway)
MAVRYRTKSFALKKEARKEADQIFTLYTEDFGKIKVLGKAIGKIKSKLRGGIGIFSLSEIEFIRGKAYNTLTDAVVINNFRNTKEDLEKLKIAYKVSEALDELINGEQPDERIWQLVNEVFGNLDAAGLNEIQKSPQSCNSLDSAESGSKLKIIYHYFLWNLLSILGYQIDLYKCAFCQERLNLKLNYFDPEEGIICQNCLSAKYPAVPSRFQQEKNGARADIIPPEVIKILRLFFKKDWQTLSRLKITNLQERSLEEISEKCLLNIAY